MSPRFKVRPIVIDHDGGGNEVESRITAGRKLVIGYVSIAIKIRTIVVAPIHLLNVLGGWEELGYGDLGLEYLPAT